MPSFIKLSSLALLLLICFANFSQAQQAVPVHVAVVDINKALLTAKASVSIREQIKKLKTTLSKKLQAEDAKLREEQQKLIQKKALLSADAFNEERRKFEQKVRNSQQLAQRENFGLQNAQKKAQDSIMKALRDVVLDISKKNGYTLVIRRAQTLIVADDMDITQKVIDALNAKLPNVSVKVQK